MSLKRVVLSALLLVVVCAPEAFAQEFSTIFNGMVGERRVVAVSVSGAYYLGDLIDDLRPYATADMTLIAYVNHDAMSEAEPRVVYVDGELEAFAENPSFSTEAPTFADFMEAATRVERGDRNGALCRDGSSTELTHGGACSFNGGVDRWRYAAVTTTDALQVVAAICGDYRFVSGEGERCGESEVLAPIKARLYTDAQPAPPAPEEPGAGEEVPTEQPVAPLPSTHPGLDIPAISATQVEWTERQNARVGFTWSAEVTNPNDERVRAVVAVRMRDGDGDIIHSDERIVALAPGQTTMVTDDGLVNDLVAARADRWTFDVAFADDDARDGDEPLNVMLIVDPLAEEARITNTGVEELDMHGWSLVSSVGNESFTFRFFKLDPGESVILTSGDSARSRLPEIYLWTSSEVWDDDGDVAELLDAAGRVRSRTNPDGSPGG